MNKSIGKDSGYSYARGKHGGQAYPACDDNVCEINQFH
jgi:hypothetical protein